MKSLTLVSIIAMLIAIPFESEAAKPKHAQIVYHFMDQTEDSVSDDGTLTINYTMESPWLNLRGGNAGFPQPIMHIDITNNSDKEVIIDYSKSEIRCNGYNVNIASLTQVYGPNAQTTISIPPHSNARLNNFNFLASYTLPYIHNLFKRDHIGANKHLGEMNMSIVSINQGQLFEFSEDASPLYIGTHFSYTIQDDSVEKVIDTSYYICNMVGTNLTMKNVIYMVANEEIVDETFPDWRNEKYIYFVLWRNSFKD